MVRANWYGEYPPACTCTYCQERCIIHQEQGRKIGRTKSALVGAGRNTRGAMANIVFHLRLARDEPAEEMAPPGGHVVQVDEELPDGPLQFRQIGEVSTLDHPALQ
jgi:hypothetical protein